MKAYLSLMGVFCPRIKQKTNQLIGIYKTAITTFLIVLCFVFAANAQEGGVHPPPVAKADTKTVKSEITALKIGDRIPDDLWNLPLQVVNHPEEKETITLNDYRGKLIILDFWATWCGSCIAMFPVMDSLQKKYAEKLQFLSVTYQKKEEVVPFLKKTEESHGRVYDTPNVINDQALAKYFQHRLIPHYVWINDEDEVVNVTNSLDMTEENLTIALGKGRVKNKIKVDIDKDAPLFSSKTLPLFETAFYSVFLKGYQSGLPRGRKKRRLNNEVIGLAIYNMTIVEMFQSLYGLTGQKFKKEDVVLNVLEPSKMRYTDANFDSSEWRSQYLYTYELAYPDFDIREVYLKMISFLNESSGYNATVKNKKLIITEKRL